MVKRFFVTGFLGYLRRMFKARLFCERRNETVASPVGTCHPMNLPMPRSGKENPDYS